MPKVDIGDAEIHYEEAGSGPPLMLVPGLGGNGSFWARQVEAFKDDFRVIIHDHRGAGQSTHSPIRYSVDQMAADVLKLMDALDIDRAISSATRPAERSARPSPRTARTGSRPSG